MEDRDAERTSVKTYVPRYQKEIWVEHAAELDMSQSEFVRTMVQAGRSDFEPPSMSTPDRDESSSERPQPSPGGALEDRVIRSLRRDGPLDWDGLVAALTESLEEELEAVLEGLQDRNAVRYRGRRGGYVVVDE